jgi:hypothetical protein
MKFLSLLVAVCLTVLPVTSFADCPDFIPQVGPGPSGQCSTAYYTFDMSCATTDGTVSSGTMSCYSWPAHWFTTGSGSVDYQMTVPLGHGNSCKSVQMYVDFSDPSAYASDSLLASVRVIHNGSVSYYNAFFQQTGNQGSLSCQIVSSGTFSAAAGDTIEVQYFGTNYTGATMKITAPLIFD